MKKHLFWFVLGAAALSSCATTDVIEEGIQSNAIGFENVVNKSHKSQKTTRALVTGDLTLDKFDQFSVYGYYTMPGLETDPIPVFDGVLVNKTGTGETTAWTYDNTRYWMPQGSYYFYAYSCANIAFSGADKGSIAFNVSAQDENEDTRIDKRSLKIEKYICDDSHQHDLICASTEGMPGRDNGNNLVKFTFRHALCKVSAEFVNDFPAGYDIAVSDVKITNFYDVANLNVRSITGDPETAITAWSGQERSAANKELAMAIAGDNNVTTSTNNEGVDATKVSTNSVFLLPVSYNDDYNDDKANIQFKLTISYGTNTLLERTIQGTWKPEWVPGRAYKYTIHITGSTAKLEPIVFETDQDMSEWENSDSDITSDMTFETVL